MRGKGEILVVGAGLSGLTAAVALGQRGLRVHLVERASGMREEGSGILLHPNALGQLRRLGVDPAEDGAPIDRQLVFTEGNKSPAVLNWEVVWGPGRRPVAVERHRLAARLLDQIDPAGIEWGREPVRFVQREDRVEVEFNRGPQGSYAIVVGADGVNSSVRRWVDPGARPAYLGQTYWRLTQRAAAPFESPAWRVWRGGPNFLGAAPVGGGRVHVFLQAALPKPPAPRAQAHATLLEIATGMGGAASSLAAAIDPKASIHVGPARAVTSNPWASGRICLLGDAAHASSPVLSQGGAMAIEDASVLAAELDRDGLTPTALAAYERRRRTRVAHVQRMSRLHLMLTQTGLTGDAATDRRPAGPVGWYRKLYAPLREAA
jgi:2-polyprenyl-6-methoxyphenol hydroxylase-like FAD-dependent oxidoreductase